MPEADLKRTPGDQMAKVIPEDGSKAGDSDENKLPYVKLFSNADFTDVCFMMIGTVGALCNGERTSPQLSLLPLSVPAHAFTMSPHLIPCRRCLAYVCHYLWRVHCTSMFVELSLYRYLCDPIFLPPAHRRVVCHI